MAAVARGRRGGAMEGIDSAGDELRCRVHGETVILFSLLLRFGGSRERNSYWWLSFGTNRNCEINSMKC